mmetsp:Transcript_84372/g.140690  ORF Transcript_84372/g.140690 Transcript_84372/m.140690 type:complete len:222 (+) Transcript_84372:766-1431(+)
MDDAHAVQVQQPGEDLLQEQTHHALRDEATLVEHPPEGTARDVLHEDGHIGVLVGPKVPHNVRVVETLQDLHFVGERLCLRGREPQRQLLDGDELPVIEAHGPVHLRKAPVGDHRREDGVLLGLPAVGRLQLHHGLGHRGLHVRRGPWRGGGQGHHGGAFPPPLERDAGRHSDAVPGEGGDVGRRRLPQRWWRGQRRGLDVCPAGRRRRGPGGQRHRGPRR